MGHLSPRPPLPATATREEMIADLARYRSEISVTILMRLVVAGAGLLAGVGMLAIAVFA